MQTDTLFYRLHRTAKRTLTVGAILFLVIVGTRPAVVNRASAWHEAWQSGTNLHGRLSGTIEGRAVAVPAGDVIRIEAGDGRPFTVRLIGLTVPSTALRAMPHERLLGEASREGLKALVLSNRLTIDLAVTNNARAGVGLARIGEVHVNAEMILRNRARLDRSVLWILPLRERYTLLRAEQMARPVDVPRPPVE